MQITATEAKNRFGYVCAQAKNEPVVIEKDGRPDSVIVSYEAYQTLKLGANKKSMAKRKKEFNTQYKDWIAEQNALVDKVGVFGEEFRPW